MKILHTSDWHLGRSLYGQKRYHEFSAFLDWLLNTIESNHIDALLIAGDVFDTSTPSNRAQQIYYRFLGQVASSCCRHIIVIAGNHDSPSFLNAPKELLQALNVHVVGAITENLEDEVIVLQNGGQPEAIVCAVPYLRDKDIRVVEPGETIDDKNAKLIEGVKQHYAGVCAIAEQKRSKLINRGNLNIPIIAMGHLFTAGGKTVDGDGVRELYVGSLAHVNQSVFPASIDYLALGHLHVSQMVGNKAHIRYSGSPIPMGFGEASQDKKVIIIEFNQGLKKIEELKIPCFQPLVRIVGSLDEIHTKIEALKQQESRAWLEIEYTGQKTLSHPREIFEEAIAGSAMGIRRIKNRLMMDRVLNRANEDETLDDLDSTDVFVRCLDAFAVPEEERSELILSYHEITQSLQEEDLNAE